MNLSPDCLHITVNSRLTQFLKAEFISQQAENLQNQVAATPQVMTWMQWWQTWQDRMLMRGQLPLDSLPTKVISDFEAQGLWQFLLEEACEQENLTLLNTTQTAKQLHQAWLYEHEYLSEKSLEQDMSQGLFANVFLTEETQLYLRVKAHYLARLTEQHLWDAALQMQQRLAWFEGQVSESFQVKLHGFDVRCFDDLTPYLKHWVSLVEAKGGKVSLAKTAIEQPGREQLFIASDETEEAQQAVIWAYHQYQTLAKNINKPKVAIVAPDLASVESALVWSLDEQLLLQEGEALRFQQTQAKPSRFYNVSLGRPLSELPLVKNALQTLEFAVTSSKAGEAAKLDYNQLSAWLVSPYTAGDFVQRQALDFRLRSWQWARLSLSELLSALRKPKTEDSIPLKAPKALFTALDAITLPGRFLTETGQQKITAKAFYQATLDLLTQTAWATTSAESSLNSVEFQQKQALLKALYQFADQLVLTQVSSQEESRLTASAWLQRLRQFVAEQVHQPESVSDAPIQVVGMLEAGGQRFDALWVMGMTAKAWPREAKPNPFLPMTLQRQYQLPRADVARELMFAQILTDRLAASAPEIVWSYPQQTEGQLNLISPLIETHLKTTADGVQSYSKQPYQTLAQTLFANRQPVDWVEDALAPPVPQGQKVPGGSAILTAQQKCPLMAFFDYRLGASKQLEAVEPGLQSNYLGTLVHQVLEMFWQQTKTQAALMALNDEALMQILNTLVDEVMASLDQHFNEHYLSLEKTRISAQLFDWLQLEKGRPPFEVKAFEQGVELDFSGMKLSVKIDRIDQQSEGLLVLDYKTGKANINDLLKQPLQAPQLAVYLYGFDATVAEEPLIFSTQSEIKGLGYGMIHSDDGVKFAVVAEDAAILPEKKGVDFDRLAAKEGGEFEGATWQDFLTHLKNAVANLADSVQQGHAEMWFEKPADVQYAASLLALRLPEAKLFLAETQNDEV